MKRSRNKKNLSRYRNIEKYYDKYGKYYEEERREGYYEFINEIEADTVIEQIKRRKRHPHVLEIGCGTGLILEKIAKETENSTGIDLSDGMLATSRAKGLNVKQANATKLPFKANSFDIVYSFKVLAHIPEIEKVIAEVDRVLKDDGIAILEFYNPFSFKAVTNKLHGAGNKVYLRFDSQSKIKEYVEDIWTIIGIRGAKVLPFSSALLRLPVISKLVYNFEHLLSNSFLKGLAGYYIVIMEKK